MADQPSLRRRFQFGVLRGLRRAQQAMSSDIVAGLKRWRFQFRLRTLLIVVTLLAVPCAYVGWQAKIVTERKAMLEKWDDGPVISVSLDTSKDAALPTIRRWLDDHFCRQIYVRQLADIERYKTAFPEADVYLSHPGEMPVPW